MFLLREEFGPQASCSSGEKGIIFPRSHFFLSPVFHLEAGRQEDLFMFPYIAEWRRVMENGVQMESI